MIGGVCLGACMFVHIYVFGFFGFNPHNLPFSKLTGAYYEWSCFDLWSSERWIWTSVAFQGCFSRKRKHRQGLTTKAMVKWNANTHTDTQSRYMCLELIMVCEKIYIYTYKYFVFVHRYKAFDYFLWDTGCCYIFNELVSASVVLSIVQCANSPVKEKAFTLATKCACGVATLSALDPN